VKEPLRDSCATQLAETDVAGSGAHPSVSGDGVVVVGPGTAAVGEGVAGAVSGASSPHDEASRSSKMRNLVGGIFPPSLSLERLSRSR
jgi:hypothetical protein